VALAFWGIIIFTVGGYFWRGARKRGHTISDLDRRAVAPERVESAHDLDPA
jgi:hypothetical protein